MYIILSQRIDLESSYSDEVFKTYHYPARYKNQIHTGDIFIYYQGNRYNKGQRYYFGMGKIGKIMTSDNENYYAELLECVQFKEVIPIYLGDSYIEQLGYLSVRKSPNPPWQSSIRPLSQEAYEYIIRAAGLSSEKGMPDRESIDENLKSAIKEYYLHNDKVSILKIIEYAQELAKYFQLSNNDNYDF